MFIKGALVIRRSQTRAQVGEGLTTNLRSFCHRGNEMGGSRRVAGFDAALAAVEADVVDTIVSYFIAGR